MGRRWVLGVCLGLLVCRYGLASEPYQDYQKRIESAQNIAALKGDLFGDSVNLYNGQTSFSNVDIELSGNNTLPVRLERRFNVELSFTGQASNFNASLEGAGGWNVEVPYITGMFGGSGGWGVATMQRGHGADGQCRLSPDGSLARQRRSHSW